MAKTPQLKMNRGDSIPAIGFGTWQLNEGREVKEAVIEALAAGYRLIDTAKIYGNERSVGEAVQRSAVPRKEIFVTTKLWQGDQGYDSAMGAFDESLEKLNTNYIDLYLIHWPEGDRQGSWKALQEIYRQGRAKNIGVSNYTVQHLEELLADAEVAPAINQIEFHPFIYEEQAPVLEFCKKHKIVVEAYTPLARGQANSHPALKHMAKRLDKTVNQLLLRWAVQHGTVPLPRSSNPTHIKENFDIFDFELSQKDMQLLNSQSNGGRVSWDPNLIS